MDPDNDQPTETPETPETPSPEEMSTSGQPDAGPAMPAPAPVTAAPPQQPVQVVAAHPRASLFHELMNTLGGGDKTQYSVDPQTGTMTAQRVPQTTGQLAKGILAGALTGLIAGAGEHGPGSVGRSVEKGGAAVMQQRQLQDLQAKQQASQDYERQQKQIVQKAQLFEANSRALMNLQQASKLGLERAQEMISGWDDFYDKAEEYGAVVNPNITEAEALEQMKSGKLKATDYQFVPRQAVDNGHGGVDIVGALVDQHPITMTDDPASLQKALRNKFVSGPPAKGAQMSNVQWGGIKWANDQVDNAQEEIKRVYDKVGGAPMPSMDDIINGDPGTAKALMKFQKYILASGGDPAKALEQMSQVTKVNAKTGKTFTNPDAAFAPLVLKAFGGQDNLDKYEEKVGGDKKAEQIKSEAEAKQQTEQNDPLYQARLTNEKLEKRQKEQQITLNDQKIKNADLANVAVKGTKDTGIAFTPDPDYPVNQEALNQLQQDNPGLAAMIKSYGEGRQVLTQQAARTKDGQAFNALVQQYYPRYNAAKVENYMKFRGDPKFQEQTQNMNRAMVHLGDYYRALGPVSGTPYLSGIERALGSEDAKTVQVAANAASDEFAKLYKGGVASVEEKKKWDDALGGASSIEKQNGAKAAAELILGQYASARTRARNNTPPGLRDDNLQLVSPEAAAAYKEITGHDLGQEYVRPTAQGPYPSQKPTPITIGGQGTMLNPDRTFVLNGHTYRLNPDNKTGTLVQ
jgi:hypothetical protein